MKRSEQNDPSWEQYQEDVDISESDEISVLVEDTNPAEGRKLFGEVVGILEITRRKGPLMNKKEKITVKEKNMKEPRQNPSAKTV